MSTTVSRRATPTSTKVLLPFRHMNWTAMVVALAAAFVPAAVTALVLAGLEPGADAKPILAVTLWTVVVGVFFAWRVISCRVVLDAEGLRRWSLLQEGRRLPRSAVAAAVILPLFNEERLDSQRQLFLVDARGRTVHRMNGLWWNDDQLGAVAAHFDVPLDTITESMTAGELRRSRAVQLQWWERHPAVAFVLAGVVICAGAAVVGGAMTLSLLGL